MNVVWKDKQNYGGVTAYILSRNSLPLISKVQSWTKPIIFVQYSIDDFNACMQLKHKFKLLVSYYWVVSTNLTMSEAPGSAPPIASVTVWLLSKEPVDFASSADTNILPWELTKVDTLLSKIQNTSILSAHHLPVTAWQQILGSLFVKGCFIVWPGTLGEMQLAALSLTNIQLLVLHSSSATLSSIRKEMITAYKLVCF